jgi:hypothetical protein
VKTFVLVDSNAWIVLNQAWHTNRKRRVDDRSRRDQVEVRQQAFAEQLGGMTDTYLEWMAALGDKGFSREGDIVYDAVEQNTLSGCRR